MRLVVNNIDRELQTELGHLQNVFCSIDDNPDGAFLEWVTEGQLFERQTHIIDVCIKKKIPMIIFDRYQKITPDEVSFLVSEGAFLWEPAVADRNFFSFQPVWGRLYTDPLQIEWDFEGERGIDLCNTSPVARKLKSFDRYYKSVHDIGKYNVFYFDAEANKNVFNKIDKMGIPVIHANWNNSDPFKTFKTTVIIGTEQQYETGYLDVDLFGLLEKGVIPLLPEEHRWYHAIFGDLVIYGEDNVDYILTMYDKIGFGCIYELYENLSTYLPECDVKNVAKRINNYFS